MSESLLHLEDTYTVCRSLKYYCVACVLLTARKFTLSSLLNLNDVITIVKLFQRFKTLEIVDRTEELNQAQEGKAIKEYRRGLSFIGIISRIMLLRYIGESGMSNEEFIKLFDERAPELGMYPAIILNPNSVIYKYLLQPVEKSGFHLTVRKMLENDIDAAFKESKSSKYSKHQYNPLRQGRQTSLSRPNMPTHNILNDCDIDTMALKTEGNTGPVYPSMNALYTNDLSGTIPYSPSSFNLEQLQGGTPGSAVPAGSGLLNGSLDGNTQNQDPNLIVGYNLGTLDEFVNNTDMNDLYNVLWSDLYSDSVL